MNLTRNGSQDLIFAIHLLTKLRNLTLAIGFVTVFPLFFIMMLSIRDADAIASATSPYMEMMWQITANKTATTVVGVWVTVALYFVAMGTWVTCGRLAWAVARDVRPPRSHQTISN